MANEEKTQEEIAAELLAQMASSRQSIADAVHDGGEVVGLENIHIEGTDIDFSSVRGTSDAPVADGGVQSSDEIDDGFDMDDIEDVDFLDADDADDEYEDDAYDDDAEVGGYDEDADADEEEIHASYDAAYDDEEPALPKKCKSRRRKRMKKPFAFTVKSAYGDAARTLMYVTITKSNKIYRWVPEPAASEEHTADAVREASES